VSQQKIPLVSEKCLHPPCFALVEHVGGKKNHHYRYWIFRGVPHDTPTGKALAVRLLALTLEREHGAADNGLIYEGLIVWRTHEHKLITTLLDKIRERN
jgi:hypothetical protein